MWRYNALLDLKYDLRVRSVALLLRPTADSKQMTGVLDLHLPDGDRVVEFRYSVVRAWQQPVEPLLTGPLATLPMATLADVPVTDVPAVLHQIDSRLMAETSPENAAINDGEDALPGRYAHGSRTPQGLEKGASDYEHP
jgi:hypothetical protein